MGNIIITQNLIDLTDKVTANGTDTGYHEDNVYDYENLMKRHRCDSEIDNDWLYEINYGSATSVAAVFLNRVNFSKVRILGHASDISSTITANGADNGDCTFDSGIITIPQNKHTGRYQAFIALTSFNYQYMWVAIDDTNVQVSDYTTHSECSSVVALSAATALTKNMSEGYLPYAEQFFVKDEFAHGGRNIIKRGDNKRWSGQLVFGNRAWADRDELLALSRLDMTEPTIFYENGCIESDISAAYLCSIDENYKGTVSTNIVTSGLMRLVEYV